MLHSAPLGVAKVTWTLHIEMSTEHMESGPINNLPVKLYCYPHFTDEEAEVLQG